MRAHEHEHKDSDNIVLSVFFSGTGFGISDKDKVAAVLAEQAISNEKHGHIVMGFHGCLYAHPAGGIFGAGLHGQVRSIIDEVLRLRVLGKNVTLNAYGHSRGAIAAQLLALALNDFPEGVSINLALLDPVGGNLDPSVALDPADITLTDQVIDLSKAKHLKKVLRLWPHEDPHLLALIAHRPVMSKFPDNCEVIDDVMLSAHAYAEIINPSDPKEKLVGHITLESVARFMHGCGTRFKQSLGERLSTDQQIFDYYENKKHKIKSTTGSPYSLSPVEVVARPDKNALYVNKHHEAVAKRLGLTPDSNKNSSQPYILFVRPQSLFKRFLWSSFKFLAIGAGIAAALYFTGGLAAIPLIAKLGILQLTPIAAAATKIASMILLPIYRVTLKPVLRGIINFFSDLTRKCFPDDKGFKFATTEAAPTLEFKSTHANVSQRGISSPRPVSSLAGTANSPEIKGTPGRSPKRTIFSPASPDLHSSSYSSQSSSDYDSLTPRSP